jgi:TRAP-type C4-dicarboxylate transport system permease large subunit
MMMLMIVGAAILFPSIAPKEPGASWRLKFIGLFSMIPVVIIIMVVLGSIYAGWATPTEAAAFGVTGALVLALINNSGPAIMAGLLKKLQSSGSQTGTIANLQERYPDVEGALRQSLTINFNMIKDAILSTVRTSSMIMLIVFSAIREKQQAADIPAPFKGAAINMITAGILSLAFLGFTGMS